MSEDVSVGGVLSNSGSVEVLESTETSLLGKDEVLDGEKVSSHIGLRGSFNCVRKSGEDECGFSKGYVSLVVSGCNALGQSLDAPLLFNELKSDSRVLRSDCFEVVVLLDLSLEDIDLLGKGLRTFFLEEIQDFVEESSSGRVDVECKS